MLFQCNNSREMSRKSIENDFARFKETFKDVKSTNSKKQPAKRNATKHQKTAGTKRACESLQNTWQNSGFGWQSKRRRKDDDTKSVPGNDGKKNKNSDETIDENEILPLLSAKFVEEDPDILSEA